MSQLYSDKVLIVDDDTNLLAAIRRQFRGTFNITTAEGGREGLNILKEDNSFSVVISDMKMPEMNGIQFLTIAGQLAPDTVRVMLTGNADLQTAMHAVNEGNIFRFLIKPCHKDTMEWAIEAAIKQHRLIVSERELLEKTLKSSVQVLTDILAMVNPAAFSHTSRIRNYVRQIAERLGLENIWQLELAAMLSQIGCITVPADTLAKFEAGAELTPSEKNMICEHPQIGKKLLEQIPRLEKVAAIIAAQQNPYDCVENDEKNLPDDLIVLGGQILRTAIDFDLMIFRGNDAFQAIGKLNKRADGYHPAILKTLQSINVIDLTVKAKTVDIHELNEKMVIAEDIHVRNGMLVVAEGQHVNSSIKTLLKNYLERKEIAPQIRVWLPDESIEKQEVVWELSENI